MSPESSPYVERIEPGQTPALELALHVSRYRFASSFVAGCAVLDAGCGVGYGSDELRAGAPASYLGVDRSVDAIRLAQRRHAGPRRLFVVADVEGLPFGGHFDVVLSFEVLEHLRDVNPYLGELRRVLRPGGTCVISTPNRRWFSDERSSLPNPFHVREYSVQEFAELIHAHFPDVLLMGQHEGSRARVVRSAERNYGRFLDRVGLRRLRRLVPIGLRTWAHKTVVGLTSRRRGVVPAAIESRDYEFTTDNLEDARILLAICRSS